MTDDGRFRLLIEAVRDYAIYMLDPSGVVTSWNAGAQRFKGYLETEIVGEHFSRFYTAEDQADGLPARALETAEREGKFESEGWRVRKDGTRFWAHVLIDPIRSPSGSLVGFAKITRDLTERRQLENAARIAAETKLLTETLEQRVVERTRQLARTEALLRTFYDYSSECHVLITRRPDGRFEFEEANEAVLRLYGMTREQVVGRTTEEIFSPERAAFVNQQFIHALAAQGPYRYERTHGDRIVEAVCATVPTEPGAQPRLVVTAHDVTEGRRLEDQLRQSQKMEAIGQLTGGIAHDFNNLLTGISGSLELLQTRLRQGRIGELERYAEMAQSAATRAAALTHRLLAFARRQTLEPKTIAVNPLVAGMEDLIIRTVGPEISVEVRADPEVWNVLVDPHQLENALLNLCINARDAMQEGGRLTIETANMVLDRPGAAARDMVAGAYVTLAVSDTGVGMSQEVIARAFDPFFTTKPVGMGTGLGLSMIYGFMHQSGGQAHIESEVGRGTKVSLYLPRDLGVTDQPPASPETLAQGHGETVLVVDDEPTVRMLVVDILQDLGYRAIEAEDGASGLRVLTSEQKLDLLVTDLGLPGGMSGRQMADAGRVLRPDLKVLFVTGYAENAAIGEARMESGTRVLAKPFAMEELARQIKELIENG